MAAEINQEEAQKEINEDEKEMEKHEEDLKNLDAKVIETCDT